MFSVSPPPTFFLLICARCFAATTVHYARTYVCLFLVLGLGLVLGFVSFVSFVCVLKSRLGLYVSRETEFSLNSADDCVSSKGVLETEPPDTDNVVLISARYQGTIHTTRARTNTRISFFWETIRTRT